MSVEAIPESYEGREQAYIKHILLGGYLRRLFVIVGNSLARFGLDRLCYVDCFAGPWQDKSETLDSTSVRVAIDAIAETREALEKVNKQIRYCALFIERDAKSFARLEKYTSTLPATGIEADAKRGDFTALRQEILRWCGSKSFAFFFVDPTGWVDIGVSNLAPLLGRPNTEILINFMYDFVNRTVPQAEFHRQVTELLGTVPNCTGLSARERELLIIETYSAALRAAIAKTQGEAFVGWAPVLDPNRNRTKYHLVYATTHPLGLVEFKTEAEKAMKRQVVVRANVKQTRRVQVNGQSEMFDASEMTMGPDESDQRICANEAFWLRELAHGPKRFDLKAFARILEAPNRYPSELQQALIRLEERGLVRNLDAKRKRPVNLLNFRVGETLALEDTKS